MFASQLLRILDAIPGDATCERTSVSDRAKQEMTIKENENMLSENFDQSGKRDNCSLVLKVKGVEECWKLNFVDDVFMNDGLASDDSVERKDQNELLNNPNSLRVHTHPLSSSTNKETTQDSLEHECSEDAALDESEYRDSTSTQIAASDLFETENNSFTDKTALEFELLELTDCCKEVKHIVKDISSDEENLDATDQKVNSASEEDSFVDRRLPIEEYGIRSFLRSFLDSTDREGNKVARPQDEQCCRGKPASECRPASSESVGRQVNMLHYDSKVESGSITFNFSTKGRTQNVDDGVVGLVETMLDHKDKDCDNLLDKVHKVKANDASEGDACKDVHRSSSEYSHFDRGKRDLGESSFSAANLAHCSSGPIPFSGSISLRSDGSTTSTRSFAFPVLQPEWSSSPVRMARADGRHFRKHKGWRSGLFCCRF